MSHPNQTTLEKKYIRAMVIHLKVICMKVNRHAYKGQFRINHI